MLSQPDKPSFLAGLAGPRPTKRREGEAERAGSSMPASCTGGVEEVKVVGAYDVAAHGTGGGAWLVGSHTRHHRARCGCLWCGHMGRGGGNHRLGGGPWRRRSVAGVLEARRCGTICDWMCEWSNEREPSGGGVGSAVSPDARHARGESRTYGVRMRRERR